MNDDVRPSRKLQLLGATGLLAAGALGGAIVAGTAAANAATPTASTSSTTESGESPTFPAHGSAAHEDQEKAVTGADATKAQAAAVKAVGSGKAGAVTTDFRGTGYEVTVTKSDGSSVEVHLDQSFTVVDHGGRAG